VLRVGISTAGPLVAADAPPASDNDKPAAPNTGTARALLRRFRFEACFECDIVDFSMTLSAVPHEGTRYALHRFQGKANHGFYRASAAFRNIPKAEISVTVPALRLDGHRHRRACCRPATSIRGENGCEFPGLRHDCFDISHFLGFLHDRSYSRSRTSQRTCWVTIVHERVRTQPPSA